ncbi:hypothetical protein Tco_0089929 [Tanacetum coccineum]
MPKSPLKLVDKPSDEGVLVKESTNNEEEAKPSTRSGAKPQGSRRTNSGTSSSGQLALTDSEMESDNEVPKIKSRDQDEGQAGPNPGNQDEGQARPNPGDQDEGQARSNPSDAAESQPQSSHVVPAGPNLEHMDLEATDAST